MLESTRRVRLLRGARLLIQPTSKPSRGAPARCARLPRRSPRATRRALGVALAQRARARPARRDGARNGAQCAARRPRRRVARAVGHRVQRRRGLRRGARAARPLAGPTAARRSAAARAGRGVCAGWRAGRGGRTGRLFGRAPECALPGRRPAHARWCTRVFPRLVRTGRRHAAAAAGHRRALPSAACGLAAGAGVAGRPTGRRGARRGGRRGRRRGLRVRAQRLIDGLQRAEALPRGAGPALRAGPGPAAPGADGRRAGRGGVRVRRGGRVRRVCVCRPLVQVPAARPCGKPARLASRLAVV